MIDAPGNFKCEGRKSLAAKGSSSSSFLFLGARTHRVNQVSEGKERDAQDGAQQVEIMANAISRSPIHSREDTERFEDVSKNNDDRRRCAKQLENGGQVLLS